MKIPQNTGKKREKKYFGISRFSLERVCISAFGGMLTTEQCSSIYLPLPHGRRNTVTVQITSESEMLFQ